MIKFKKVLTDAANCILVKYSFESMTEKHKIP